jgi:5-methyltetrahydropteroyltriglutamate--homocysteine methyltransferase
MPRNSDRILTTHVGSLVRPPQLVAHLRRIEDKQPHDEAAYEACLTESVAELVQQRPRPESTSSPMASSAKA